ncbi:MAG: DUF4232 domain-containing protein [Nocardioides sp.]|uniref:DUF4232 domain-containing protein n=1 Tax=Nocardioides sp. TaxID=35761 RepID=UPI0039E621F9
MRPSRILAPAVLLVAALLPASLAGPARAARPTVATECTAGQLAAGYVRRGAGASHRFGALRLTNVSATRCWLRGYGGLSFVGGGDGTQVGHAATRTPSTVRRVWLAPGERAASLVDQTTAAPYGTRRCRPTAVDGFRVYPPDSTVSLFVAHRTRTCANSRLTLLAHRAYRKVG